MENGTVRILSDGHWYEGKAKRIETEIVEVSSMQDVPDRIEYKITLSQFPTVMGKEKSDEHPAPFNDGEYLHYTRFHPQLKDMIGTEGYFYDTKDTPILGYRSKIVGVSDSGYPLSAGHNIWAYFAVPIEKPKTEITLQEIADKFGVAVEQLRIKE